jgi:hypothetical protein
VHAERAGGIGHVAADRAKSDHADRAPRNLVADELFLTGFHGLVQDGVVALESGCKRPALAQVTAADDEAGESPAP